jgi:4-hydroxybenzoate polyprenyltransferase
MNFLHSALAAPSIVLIMHCSTCVNHDIKAMTVASATVRRELARRLSADSRKFIEFSKEITITTDIQNHSRILNALPKAAKPYGVLMRLDRPIGWWLLLLPGWWAILLAAQTQGGMGLWNAITLGLFWVGAIIMRGTGCVINDLWDQDLDKKVTRTADRPLANGTVTQDQAVRFLVILLGIGFCILLLLPPVAILLGALSIPLIASYPLMKRFTFWPQAFLGLTFNFSALIGWAAVTNSLSLTPLVLYGGCILWTLGYDTIYAHQDKEDDVMAGIKSTALKFGQDSMIWVAGFYAGAYLLIHLAFLMAGAGLLSHLILLGGGYHMLWQIHRWSPEEPDTALDIFKSNKHFGFWVLVATLL